MEKVLLLHAIRPEDHDEEWGAFLEHAALLSLPANSEPLAQNVWLLPDDQTYLMFSRIGHQFGVEIQIRKFFFATGWQLLSRHP